MARRTNLFGADDSRRDGLLMKKKTQVTIRTRRTLVVHGLRVRCHQCGAEVPIISPDNAAGVLQTTTDEIRGLLASGDLHAVDERSGAQVICGNSLSAATETESGAIATGSSPISIEGERK